MKTYEFRVVVKPDEERWQAYCPTLEEYAAYTWGYTREEAVENIKEVIEMVLEELSEDGLPVPQEPARRIDTRRTGVGRLRTADSSFSLK